MTSKFMINYIPEKRVPFELALMLQKQGFSVISAGHCWLKTLDGKIIHDRDRKDRVEHDRAALVAWEPTVSLVLEWIRLNFGFRIESLHQGDFGGFTYKIIKLNIVNVKQGSHYMPPQETVFNSPEEAEINAIQYVLNNLS